MCLAAGQGAPIAMRPKAAKNALTDSHSTSWTIVASKTVHAGQLAWTAMKTRCVKNAWRATTFLEEDVPATPTTLLTLQMILTTLQRLRCLTAKSISAKRVGAKTTALSVSLDT